MNDSNEPNNSDMAKIIEIAKKLFEDKYESQIIAISAIYLPEYDMWRVIIEHDWAFDPGFLIINIDDKSHVATIIPTL